MLKLALACLLLGSSAFAKDCGPEGDATRPAERALNPLKNRVAAPATRAIQPAITLPALLRAGGDENRWSTNAAAQVTGYVVAVKPGGLESCNCHAKGLLDRDTHIELALDAAHSAPGDRLIVEVTPRMRATARAAGQDWSTGALQTQLTHRDVTFIGWMFWDAEHVGNATHTHPGGKRNWRATCWELHPVTTIALRAERVN